MRDEPTWMEKPLHWIANIWLFAGLAAGGKSPNRLTRMGIWITSSIFLIAGAALLAQGDLLWGIPFFTWGTVQMIALALFHFARH